MFRRIFLKSKEGLSVVPIELIGRESVTCDGWLDDKES